MTTEVPADLVEEVRLRLAREDGPVTPQRVSAALRAAGRPVGDATVLAVHEAMRAEILGAGPLDGLLALPGVTDVLVNGPGDVWLDRGRGLERADVDVGGEEAVRRLAARLAAVGGRRLDDATPYADVRLADGTRCHAVLAPVARTGTALSLRVLRRTDQDLDDLVACGTLTAAGRELLDRLLRRRRSFLVTGGTGAGKTTLLAALLSAVDPGERIVLVEDLSELMPRHPHVVALEARPPNVEGAGGVDLRTLVRQALRMRPDRLVVGEVRGGEVVDLLAAMNTGHEGGCGTVHANSAADVPARIEALALAAGLWRGAAHSQLAAAVDVVLHLARGADGRRRLVEVAVPRADVEGLVEMVTAVRFDEAGRTETGAGAQRLAELVR